MRDIETEEMLEELHGKIRELEKQNGQLKEKVSITVLMLKRLSNKKQNLYNFYVN